MVEKEFEMLSREIYDESRQREKERGREQRDLREERKKRENKLPVKI
jgi:hypothetical protein